MSATSEPVDTHGDRYGNAFLLSDAPDNRAAGRRHAGGRCDAAAGRGAGARRHPVAQPGDLRHHVDGARGAAHHRGEPAPQLHRSRRVPADGGDRAALHPDARRPLPRAGRDDRHAHAGLVGGDHARRAVAEVEVAGAARGRRQADGPAEPRVRRRRARGVGEVLPLLRRRAADHPAAAAQVHHRPRGRRAASRREHDRGRRGPRHDVHGARRRHRRDQRPARAAARGRRASTSRCTSTAPAAASCGRSSTPTRRGTSAWSGCAPSTCRATSTASSTRGSAGSCSASPATCPRTSSSTRTTSASATRRSR